MSKITTLEDLLISTPHGSDNEYESTASFEESDPYIKWLAIDFAVESESDSAGACAYSKQKKVDSVARLSGALILGSQAMRDGEDVIGMCDDCSGDLYEAAEELERENLLEDFDGEGKDILYIHSLELSSELMDSCALRQFFDSIPRYVFQYANVMPQVICYQIASVDGYYEKAAARTRYDPRSVNETSPQLFIKNGYTTSDSGILLYRVIDGGARPACEGNNPGPSTNKDAQESRALPKASADQLHDEFHNGLDAITALNKRSLLENHLEVGHGTHTVLMPRTAPKSLTRYVSAALLAHQLGIRMDRALEKHVSDLKTNVPAIHDSFQKMYFAGKTHMDSTIERMHPKNTPSAGETFADAALVRAANSYYVAALLYREGHMIEAHAMSRLMLEQIAWAFAVCEVEDYCAAKKVTPSKAIGKLKKKIEPVGRMYGALSNYAHLPLQGHREFIDLSHGKSRAMQQFRAHSYAHGTIISDLADYWSAVYEYTQSRHFHELESWIETPLGLELIPNRIFLSTIEPIRKELIQAYEAEYPSYDEYIRSHWTINDTETDEPGNECRSSGT